MNDTTKGARRVSDEAVQRTIDTWSEKRIIRVDGFKRDVFNLALDLRDERAAHAETRKANESAMFLLAEALRERDALKAALAALVDRCDDVVQSIGEMPGHPHYLSKSDCAARLMPALTAAREVGK